VIAGADQLERLGTAEPPTGEVLGASIIIRDLGKYFGDVIAVRKLSLDVRAGEFLSLLGASGSGKSTVLRMIAGLEEPDSGTISIDGRDATRLPPEARGIGMVFQDYALFPHMTVWQNIAFPLRMRHVARETLRRKVARVMELVNINGLEARRPAELSGGQQQRVALARALVFDPKVLLLDEPLSALDKKLRDYMKGELKTLHRRIGVTIIYVTHDQSEALAMSDRIAVLHNGMLVDVDTPSRLYRSPTSPLVAGFIGDANLIDGEILSVNKGGFTLNCALGTWCVSSERVRTRNGGIEGTPITIVLRPESIVLEPGDSAPGSMVTVPCEVMEVLYSGSHTLYTLRSLKGAIDLSTRSTEEPEAARAPGSIVNVGLLVGRSVVVDRGP
jgi:putative spermidine/putrescine transport system ATP-binding protein